MNILITTVSSIVLACALSSAHAQDTKDAHAGHHATAPQSPQVAPPMQKMQENMQAMRDLMSQIHSTRDPAERMKLMQQHRELMQAQMKMMNDMGMDAGCGSMMGGGDPDRRPMMQMMMEQMMEHIRQGDAK